MDIIQNTKEILSSINKILEELCEKVESNIFSPEIEENLKELEEKIKKLPEMISKIIEYSRKQQIPYDTISQIINSFSDTEGIFSKFLSKLELISTYDSKRLESLRMLSLQMKAASSMTSKGQNIKTKK